MLNFKGINQQDIRVVLMSYAKFLAIHSLRWNRYFFVGNIPESNIPESVTRISFEINNIYKL